MHLSWKSWEEGHHNNDFEVLFIYIGFLDSLNDGFNDFVFDAHKELVFNVNELLGVSDQFDVSKVDGLFNMLKHAHAPVRAAPDQMVFDLDSLHSLNVGVVIPSF